MPLGSDLRMDTSSTPTSSHSHPDPKLGLSYSYRKNGIEYVFDFSLSFKTKGSLGPFNWGLSLCPTCSGSVKFLGNL